MPIKTAEHIHAWLEREDADFIESVDFFEGGWIKTGIKEERLIYRHWFNERKHKRLFCASLRRPGSRTRPSFRPSSATWSRWHRPGHGP